MTASPRGRGDSEPGLGVGSPGTPEWGWGVGWVWDFGWIGGLGVAGGEDWGDQVSRGTEGRIRAESDGRRGRGEGGTGKRQQQQRRVLPLSSAVAVQRERARRI